MTLVTQSHVAGRWVGAHADRELHHAVTGEVVAATHAETIDFGEVVRHARERGLPALLEMDFQRRAGVLRALARHLATHKDVLYARSAWTGATRADGAIDIDGGIATLNAYAAIGAADLPSGNLVHEGPVVALGKSGSFCGTHVLVPRHGVAVHIDAFNFPVWGLLEKFAPSFLAAMPCIVKPATSTAYLAQACVRLMLESGLLPEGALQLVIGGAGDLLERLGSQDVVSFTGSADTAAMLRVHPNVTRHAIAFNAEADSLNCAILGPDAEVGGPAFERFVDEVVRETIVKAGQKCTAIRRAIVPAACADALAERLQARLREVVVGDPARDEVRMGPLVSLAQRHDVLERIAQLRVEAQLVCGGPGAVRPLGADAERGAFVAPTLLRVRDAAGARAVHEVEAFGPVCTLLSYRSLEEALGLAAAGRGSLVGSIVTDDVDVATALVARAAAWHGRLLVLDADCARASTGHGTPLPALRHGGPGRAGGGDELGGVRAVIHYLQRSAVQGSPRMLAAITGEHVRGAPVHESDVHPFRRHFDELRVGDSLLTHRRTITEADIVNFGCLSGDFFYMHFDEAAAKASPFGRRIAHGYFVLSAAAGLFVWPSPGPVLANYGLDTLRFVKPVTIGDTIQARLTCKRKTERPRRGPDDPGQGVVAWDVQVSNQDGDVVASYDILTLVARRAPTDGGCA